MDNNAQQIRASRPILFVDVDGVISLYGFDRDSAPPGRFHSVDGILHCIGHEAGRRLRRLGERFELVWATGWEEKANEHLPHLLALGGHLAIVEFDDRPKLPEAHWKLDAIDAFAGNRPAAWIDDSLDAACERWAADRPAPTLLVPTNPAVGITDDDVERLLAWAREVGGR